MFSESNWNIIFCLTGLWMRLYYFLKCKIEIELINFFFHPPQEVPIIQLFFVLKSGYKFYDSIHARSFAHRQVSLLSVTVCITMGSLTAVFNTQTWVAESQFTGIILQINWLFFRSQGNYLFCLDWALSSSSSGWFIFKFKSVHSFANIVPGASGAE